VEAAPVIQAIGLGKTDVIDVVLGENTAILKTDVIFFQI